MKLVVHHGGCHCGRVRFEAKAPAHLFCRVCGVKSFYLPRSHPDGVSVNARCLDDGTVQGPPSRRSTGATGSRRGKRWAEHWSGNP